MTDLIKTTKADGVLTIELNRPEKKNALTPPMYLAMCDALDDANNDPAVRVIVFQGSGGSFTAGNDLMDFMNTPPAGPDSPVLRFLSTLSSTEKVVVAGVQGAAIGVGTTMLPHCDIVYADDTARFQMPFVNLGLVPENAASLLLPRIMGPAKASALLMFGDKFDANKAYECGLLSEILPSTDFVETVRARAIALAEKPPASLRLTKMLIRRATVEQVKETILFEGVHFLERLGSDEAREAFTAFFEKRKPDFSKLSS